MALLELRNFFIHVFVTYQVDGVDLVLINKVEGLKLKILQFGFVAGGLIKVQDAFFIRLRAEFLNLRGGSKILNWVVYKVVDDVSDLKFGGVL